MIGWWLQHWGTPRTVTGTYQKLGSYSAVWAHGGPIIEQEGIELHGSIQDAGNCWAQFYRQKPAYDGKRKHYHRQEGPTPLIAAMRCYVMAALGEEIEIPKELK